MGLNDDIELIDSTFPPVDREGEIAVGGRRSGLAAAAVVAVLVVAVMSLAGGEDRPPLPPIPTTPGAELPVDVTVGTADGEGPVLGPDTGLSLLAGGPNTPLRVLDLDTGALTVTEAVVEPRFLAGPILVHRSESGTWSRDGLDDLRSGAPLDSDASRFRPQGEPAHVVPRDEETVWLTWPRPDRRRDWQLIDLATLSVRREVTTPLEARILGGDTPFSGPEVIGFTTGGVHELVDDGTYRPVLGGRLVAVGRDEILVRQCFPGAACVLNWFERGTWAFSGRRPPEADLVNGRLVADDRLLAGTVDRPAFGAGLYDIESGERLRSLGPTPLGQVTASPDGAWLLRRLFGRVEAIEVATGATVEIPDFPLGGGDSVIWLRTE